MSWFKNLPMTPKLIGSFVLVALFATLVCAVGTLGFTTLQSDTDAVTGDSVPGMVRVLTAKDDVSVATRFTRGILLSTNLPQRQFFARQAAVARQEAWNLFSDYFSTAAPFPTAREEQAANQTNVALRHWMQLDSQVERLGLRNTRAADAAGRAISDGSEAPSVLLSTAGLKVLVQVYHDEIQRRVDTISSAHDTAVKEMLGVGLLALLFSIAVGIMLARSIARPLAEVRRAAESVARLCLTNLAKGMQALARGDLTMEAAASTSPPTYQSRNEIGQTAEAIRGIIGKTQEAVGDYEAARAELRNLIGQVANTSRQVDSGAGQLAQATQQIGQATTQIARAIEEVARGTGEQSRNAGEVTSHMAEFVTVVAQMSSGADAQSRAVEQANQAITQLRGALEETTQQLGTVIHAADRAAATAKDGGAAVGKTIASINGVRGAVARSAEQVQALGQRSREVGQIVEAIEDIASQTNLLALNAAIEAARAGEHGKGFTVVAAEVRKLAERASNETKEITQRIAAIQRQVSEVVAAMEAGNAEVTRSALLGQEAGSALESILAVVEETTSQVRGIGSVIARMKGTVEEVNGAAGNVADVATRTVEAATHLRGGTERIRSAIETISAVSEQSAAGAEEVSASTEEQTASVEEMAAGAQELAALASQLQTMVGRFVIEDEALTPTDQLSPLQRRRAQDWQAPQTPAAPDSRRRA